MKVLMQTHQTNNYPQSHFGNTMRTIYDAQDFLENCNYTKILRDGKDFWKKWAQMINRKYPDGNLNLTCYGCSEGSETNTMVISLYTWAKNFAKNFNKPIQAYDTDPYIIEQAQKGVCNVRRRDLFKLMRILKLNYFKFFSTVPRTDVYYDIGLLPKDIVRNKIQYGVADIFEHLDTLGNERNGINSRNFLYLLDDKIHEPLFEKLHEKTLNNGYIVVGEGDYDCVLRKILKRQHFEQSDDHHLIYFPY